MEHSVLDKQIVLRLNAAWQPIGFCTVRKALVAMMGDEGTPPSLGMDVGDEYCNTVKWDDWMKLPVREGDLQIMTGKGPLRAPVVIVDTEFAKMPVRRQRLSRGNIRERDGGICQYTGVALTRKEGNVDHVVPLSKGGKNTWENMVWCKEKLNRQKGNRLNHEIGLTLIRTPKAPKAVPASYLIKESKHPHHASFIQG